jgi:hypothetical protein
VIASLLALTEAQKFSLMTLHDKKIIFPSAATVMQLLEIVLLLIWLTKKLK